MDDWAQVEVIAKNCLGSKSATVSLFYEYDSRVIFNMFDIDKARPIIRSCIKRGRSPTETFYALSKKGSDWVEPDDRVEEWLRMLSKGSLKSCSNQPKSDDIDLLVTITEEFQMKKSAIFLFPSDEDDYSFVLLDDRCGVRVQTVDPTKCSLIFIDFFHGKQM